MTKHIRIAGMLALTFFVVSGEARAQNILGDLFREAVDENRLEQDYQRLGTDAANGNVVGEMVDIMRIQQDQARLSQDRQQLNYDLNGGTYYPQNNSLIQSQTYPGYYYYQNNPGQLYYYPNQ